MGVSFEEAVRNPGASGLEMREEWSESKERTDPVEVRRRRVIFGDSSGFLSRLNLPDRFLESLIGLCSGFRTVRGVSAVFAGLGIWDFNPAELGREAESTATVV
jgi:hypothetical protein